MISKPYTMHRIFCVLRVTLGVVLCAAWLAGCEGGGKDRGGDSISVDIRPLVEQMGGSSGSAAQGVSAHSTAFGATDGSSRASPLSVTSPGNSIATTDVLSLIIGAIAIGFQDTPIGPTTPITDSLKASLKTAAINSIKFLAIVNLPTATPFVEFDIPPPGAVHWQIVAVGARNSIQYLTDLKDDSPIYYGFNTDSAGNPTFLSAATATAAPIDVTMTRACIVSSPPNGCAQYKDRATPMITGGVEILHVYGVQADGTLGGELLVGGPLVVRSTGGALCNSAAGCTVAVATAAMPNAVALSTFVGVVVQTTHQRNPAESAACTGVSTDTSADTGALGNCNVSSYMTPF